MKKFVPISLIFLIFASASNAQMPLNQPPYLFAYFIGNGEDGLHYAYSTDGYAWTALHRGQSVLPPAVSKDKLMRDPCIIRGKDGMFHMVWTVSWTDIGIGYASSTDLIHWSRQQFIPVMGKERGTLNCWAPEITYDESARQYMIYWASTVTGKFPATAGQGDGPYNHRMYYTTTADFNEFAPTKLLYDPGFSVIDATIVKDSLRYIMILKDETLLPAQKNLKICYSPSLTGPYSAPSAAITGKYWAEGPTTLRNGKKWIVYFDKYADHTYGALASNDLQGWEDISETISLPQGIRHGSILPITSAELDKLKIINVTR